MKTHVLVDREYCAEGVIDIGEDIEYEMDKLPVDGNGFMLGTLHVTVEWIPPEDE